MKIGALKGTYRRTVVVRSADSKLFEEAYFILREESPTDHLPDLLQEANRIVEESRFPRPRKQGRGQLRSFLRGMLCGGLFTGTIWGIWILFGQ